LSEGSFRFSAPLKAIELFSSMGVGHHEELDLCEECASPLEDGICRSCGLGFSDGASPVGAAPLGRSELSRVLGRPVGARAHGSYALSMQQEEGMAPLRKQIELLVEQFSASPAAKSRVKQNAERLAVKIVRDVGPTKAAIASVAQEFLALGRNLAEVSLCISGVHPRVARLSGLVVRVYVRDERAEPDVLVGSRRRGFVAYSEGLYRRLRIPVYCWDDGALVELRNAVLCKRGNPEKRMRVLSPRRFRLVLPEKTFQLFRIIEEAKLSGAIQLGEFAVEPVHVARKYSIARLPLTEKFLRETGYLNRVNARYAALLRERLADGRGRMPRKLAEQALTEACSEEIPEFVSDLVADKYRLKRSEMSSLVVLPELEAWRLADTVS